MIGDAIAWFDPPGRAAPLSDDRENVGGLVRVPGAVERSCPTCGFGAGAALWLRDDVVDRVEILRGEAPDEVVQVQPPAAWMRFWSRRIAGSANEDRLEIGCRGSRF